MQTKNLSNNSTLPPAGAYTGGKRDMENFLSRHQLTLLLFLILGEALIIALFVHPRSAQHGGALAYVSQLGIGIKYLIYFTTALLLALTARLPAIWRSLSTANKHHNWVKFGITHLLCYGFLLFAISVLIPHDLFQYHLPTRGYESIWSAYLISCMAATLLSSLLMLAPSSYWISFVRNEKLALVLAAFFTALPLT